jgi:phage-related minor tail protein
VVHRGEFVFNKEATRRIGVDNLERLHELFASFGRRTPGSYASGGSVSSAALLSGPGMSAGAMQAERSIAALNAFDQQIVLPVESLRTVERRVTVREERSTL